MAIETRFTRKQVLKGILIAAVAPAVPGVTSAQQGDQQTSDITLDDLKTLEKMICISRIDW